MTLLNGMFVFAVGEIDIEPVFVDMPVGNIPTDPYVERFERAATIAGQSLDDSYLFDIDIITISTLGDAVKMGDLATSSYSCAATSNAENGRGIQFGGDHNFYYGDSTIFYFSFSGDIVRCAKFGDMTVYPYLIRSSGTSNGVNERGLFINGQYSANSRNTVEFVTVNTLSDSSLFGYTPTASYGVGACSNDINERAISFGGYNTSDIRYFTVNSASNSSFFGSLPDSIYLGFAVSNGVNERGVQAGGYTYNGVTHSAMNFVTMNSLSDSSYFNELSGPRRLGSSASNGVNERGVFGGGYSGAEYMSSIEYITLNSMSSGMEFGSLSVPKIYTAGCSSGIGVGLTEWVPAGYGYALVIGGAYLNLTTSNDYINKMTISTLGSCTYTGHWRTKQYNWEAVSNGTNDRGVTFGGSNPVESANDIYFTTISSSIEDCSFFGELIHNTSMNSAASNGTNERGMLLDGIGDLSRINTEFITLNTQSGSSYGGEWAIRLRYAAGTSNDTNERAVSCGGWSDYVTYDDIKFTTLNTLSDCMDFGLLTEPRDKATALSNGINERGVIGTRQNWVRSIEYITLNTLCNGLFFGNVTSSRHAPAGVSDKTGERGLFCGGSYSSVLATVDFITINSASNAEYWGELTYKSSAGAAASNSS